MTRLALALLVLAAVVLASPAVANSTGSVSPAEPESAGAGVMGDVDCSGVADSIDALQVLRSVASLPVAADCLAQAADVDCSAVVDSIDGLLILRFVASLSVNTPAGCTPIGDPLGPPGPTSAELIDQALADHQIDSETALVYKVFAAFGDSRLPQQYRGDDSRVLDSDVMVEVSTRWATLTQDTRSTLVPFFAPPVYEGSGVRDLDAASPASPVGVLDAQPVDCTDAEGAPPVMGLDWSRRVTAHFSVWYRPDKAQADETAGFIAGEIENIWQKETDLMGRFPLQDNNEKCNGGDGTWDIYVGRYGFQFGDVTALSFRGLTQGYPGGCKLRPTYMLVNYPVATTLRDTRSILAHEFFHFIEVGAYDLLSSCGEYSWLGEATATYMMDFVYPDDDYEQEYADDYLGASFTQGGGFLAPLEHPYWAGIGPESRNGYEDYLFLFYIARKFGPTHIRDIWDYVEVFDSLAAVDAGIPGGFLERWPEFALYNWNRPAVDYYEKWDALLQKLAPSHAAYEFHVSLGGQGQREFPMSRISLEHLSSKYVYAEFPDDKVRTVKFDNLTFESGDLGDLGRSLIQAWIKLGDGSTRVEDWTFKQDVTFCRDKPSQDVRELFVVWSDSTYLDRQHITNTIVGGKLTAKSAGCGDWVGIATATGDMSAPGGHEVQTVSVQVRFKADYPPGQTACGDPPVACETYSVASGSLTYSHVIQANGCTETMGPTTVSLPHTPPEAGGDGSLVVYTGADPQTYDGWGGLTFDDTLTIVCPGGTTTIPAGANPIWLNIPAGMFQVKPDGTLDDTYTDGVTTWHWHFDPVPAQ